VQHDDDVPAESLDRSLRNSPTPKGDFTAACPERYQNTLKTLTRLLPNANVVKSELAGLSGQDPHPLAGLPSPFLFGR